MKPFEWARLVCADPAVSPMARYVAMTLALHSRGAYTPQSRCSHAQLAEWTGLSRSTVLRAMADLVAAEYVVSIKQHAKSGARAASLHLMIHPSEAEDPVDNRPMKRQTKVSDRHHHGVTVTLRSVRAQAAEEQASDLRRCSENQSVTVTPPEDRRCSQDASGDVLDLAAHIAQRTRF